ncbi:diacylglycerol kinase family protein [Fibrobacter sp. HC4]|uniref:diacylglycerol/lipid kinase family protein n=1 Tax=Fibrobacter sp. HC4 TaxID=3239812 RepID=UPI002018D2B2|nr:lipid kinase YegS [Fibrobacter succinogenes]MCQ2101467.1 diacylglycerol kinase [Fibrobacter sp.]
MYKFVFLINPISGGGQGKEIYKFLPEIMASMNYKDDQWKAEFTVHEGMEKQITDALENTETLIAVGGDGTVSSVLSVLVSSEYAKTVKIGLIPLGTGNDLARVLNLYKPYVDKGLLFLVRRLLQSKARPFDIWKVNGKIAFANYFSGGIDARIAHDFNRDRSQGAFNSNSVIANRIHYVDRFFADRNYTLKQGKIRFIDAENVEHSQDVSGHRTVIVGNIPSFAGGSQPFYKSDMADGLLEVVCVPNMFMFLAAIAIGSVPLLGNFVKKFFLVSKKAKSLTLDFAEDEFLQLDGEDLTGKLGNQVKIDYACKVKILSLGS